jgi:hypothetical protein
MIIGTHRQWPDALIPVVALALLAPPAPALTPPATPAPH